MLGVIAIVLGIVFEGQNVAFMVGLAFAIAASANFPALLMSIFWRRFTTGARSRASSSARSSALVLIYLSPTIQVDVLGTATGALPAQEPGPHLDAARVRGRHRRVAAAARESEARPYEAERQIHLGAAAPPGAPGRARRDSCAEVRSG